jgi:serralysin
MMRRSNSKLDVAMTGSCGVAGGTLSRSDADKIDLRAIDANTTIAGDQAFTSPFSGAAGELRWFTDPTFLILRVAATIDANVTADFELDFRGGSVPTAGDFML